MKAQTQIRTIREASISHTGDKIIFLTGQKSQGFGSPGRSKICKHSRLLSFRPCISLCSYQIQASLQMVMCAEATIQY